MPRPPRSKVFDPDSIGVYHCTQRCVRQAFLCDEKNPKDQPNRTNRRQWIRDRLEFLTGVFPFECLDYSLLSNHLHVVLRNRPDIAELWSAEEVVRRWLTVYPGLVKEMIGDGKRKGEKLGFEDVVKRLSGNRKKVRELRDRLKSISWYMKALTEPIAKLANAEDGVSGSFWQGRFRCQKPADEAAILACSLYVDLNQIRAGMANCPEKAKYSSAYDRIKALEKRGNRPASKHDADAWLSPVQLKARDGGGPQDRPSRTGKRPTDRGFLDMTTEEYLELLDWTGRQVRAGKQEATIPAHLAPILERLGIVPGQCLKVVTHYEKFFRCVVGCTKSMQAIAQKRNIRWLHGIRRCREVFCG